MEEVRKFLSSPDDTKDEFWDSDELIWIDFSVGAAGTGIRGKKRRDKNESNSKLSRQVITRILAKPERK